MSSSGWTIPPCGWCVTCLIAFERNRAAAAIFKGTSLCEEHIVAVLQPDLDAALEEYEAEGKSKEEVVIKRSTSWGVEESVERKS